MEPVKLSTSIALWINVTGPDVSAYEEVSVRLIKIIGVYISGRKSAHKTLYHLKGNASEHLFAY